MRLEKIPFVRSYRQAGRLVPPQAMGLRASTVRLSPGGVMDWHSTRSREELLVALSGRVWVEVRSSGKNLDRVSLRKGQCAFLPKQTDHRLINRSRANALYIYVTAPASRPALSHS